MSLLTNALIAGTAIALVCGIMSIFVMSRRLPFLTHTISEIGFSGAAFGIWAGIQPIQGMICFTILAAIITNFTKSRFSSYSDASISAVSALFMGSGVLFLALASGNTSYATNLLFGSITAVSTQNVWEILFVVAVVMLALLLIYRPLKLDSFDPAGSAYSNIKSSIISFVFLILTALTVSVAAQVVGALLIFVLLTLPAAIAFYWGRNFGELILISVLCALVGTWGGLYLGYVTNLPVTFFITIIETGLYFISVVIGRKN